MTDATNLHTLIQCAKSMNEEFHRNMAIVFGDKAEELTQILTDNLAYQIRQLAQDNAPVTSDEPEQVEEVQTPVVESKPAQETTEEAQSPTLDMTVEYQWFNQKGKELQEYDMQLVEDNYDYLVQVKTAFENKTITPAMVREVREFMTNLLTSVDDDAPPWDDIPNPLVDGVTQTPPVVIPKIVYKQKSTGPAVTQSVDEIVQQAKAEQEAIDAAEEAEKAKQEDTSTGSKKKSKKEPEYTIEQVSSVLQPMLAQEKFGLTYSKAASALVRVGIRVSLEQLTDIIQKQPVPELPDNTYFIMGGVIRYKVMRAAETLSLQEN